MSAGASCDPRDEHCITCGDVAVPMRVLAVDEAACLALCAAADTAVEGAEQVAVELVGAVRPGDLLLVHAGTALATLDGDAA